jgi:hypothetical protein
MNSKKVVLIKNGLDLYKPYNITNNPLIISIIIYTLKHISQHSPQDGRKISTKSILSHPLAKSNEVQSLRQAICCLVSS